MTDVSHQRSHCPASRVSGPGRERPGLAIRTARRMPGQLLPFGQFNATGSGASGQLAYVQHGGNARMVKLVDEFRLQVVLAGLVRLRKPEALGDDVVTG